MLNKELKHCLTMNPEEKASARDIVEDAYEEYNSVNGIVYHDDPSNQELIETINKLLPSITDPDDASDLVKFKAELERDIVADWISSREKYYSMKAVIDNLTDIDYQRYRNFKSGLIKLTMNELQEIKKAMKSIQRDNFIDR